MTNKELLYAASTIWVVIAGVLVMFMQAGFAFLEAGLTRMKNVGHIAAKNVLIFALASVVYYLVGFGIAFGDGGNGLVGGSGFFPSTSDLMSIGQAPFSWFSEIPGAAGYLFEVVFCGVSLAIVWGAMAERTKLYVYIVFGAGVHPGLLGRLALDLVARRLAVLEGACRTSPDRPSSTTRAPSRRWPGRCCSAHGSASSTPTGRRTRSPVTTWPTRRSASSSSGSAGSDSTRARPCRSTSAALGFFAYVALNTNIAAAAGVFGALITSWLVIKKPDISMMLNGAIAALVAITAACAFVAPWGALLIGFVAGVIVVLGVLLVERIGIDDPIGAVAAHGMAGVWGTLSLGLLTLPSQAKSLATGSKGLFYGGGLHQLGVQALGLVAVGAFTFGASFLILLALKLTWGIRVDPEVETGGLDVHEHGMWGYPEFYIPVPGGYGTESHGHLGHAHAMPQPAVAGATVHQASSLPGTSG